MKPKYTIPGGDIAGLVEAVGRNVKQFQPGDEVYGDLGDCGFRGYAEYVSAPENNLALKPTNLSFEEAAAVPQAAVVALQGLRNKGKIKSGQKVLINGSSGGIGTFAVQIAKSYDTEVTGVCSTANVELVKSLGADEVIDYTKEDFAMSGRSYDVVFDAVGKISLSQRKRALKKSGVFMSVKSSPKFQADDLDRLRELIEAEKLKAVIDREYTLDDVAQAHEYVENGHKKGNVVITVASEGC